MSPDSTYSAYAERMSHVPLAMVACAEWLAGVALAGNENFPEFHHFPPILSMKNPRASATTAITAAVARRARGRAMKIAKAIMLAALST